MLEFLKERIYFPVCLQTKSILICQATVRRKNTALHVNVFDFQRESGLYVLFRINHTLKSNGLAIFYYHMISPGAAEFGRTPFKSCERTVKKADAKYLFMISSSYSWKSILLSKIPGLTWPRAILKSPYKFERRKENLSTDYASRLH